MSQAVLETEGLHLQQYIFFSNFYFINVSFIESVNID